MTPHLCGNIFHDITVNVAYVVYVLTSMNVRPLDVCQHVKTSLKRPFSQREYRK